MPGIYAGIGSRETPKEILNLMHSIAYKLCYEGWTLQSGGAIGADLAFESGVDKCIEDHKWLVCGGKRIFTPENLIKTSENLKFCNYFLLPTISKNRNFHNFKPSTKELLQRNVHQILGLPKIVKFQTLISESQTNKEESQNSYQLSLKIQNLIYKFNPVKFVIYWIPGEDIWDENMGGTRYALRIAKNLEKLHKINIPLFNLKNIETRTRFEKWLEIK